MSVVTKLSRDIQEQKMTPAAKFILYVMFLPVLYLLNDEDRQTNKRKTSVETTTREN